jgi:copper chaperone CopZ
MSLSSLSVVSNALRLRLFRPGSAPAEEAAERLPQTLPGSSTVDKKIKIEGMSCAHCSASVEKALRAVPGVTEVRVDLALGTASLKISPDCSEADLKAAVSEAGFRASSL